tara:strand:+ start:17664 stop:18011 length:348 start_codon:yes stop_codon:yes gene_type:complete
MELIQFTRYVTDGMLRFGSSAEIIYIPSKETVIDKLTLNKLTFQYKINTSLEILKEAEKIYKKQEPYSEKARIDNIKYITADESDVNQFLEDIKSQKTLQERIESTAEKIFSLDQ